MADPKLMAIVKDLQTRVSLLEGVEQGIRYSESNVSDPPTDAQLDSAFGTPANLYNGFIGIVNDNGDATAWWICVAGDSVWAYVAKLTVAV